MSNIQTLLIIKLFVLFCFTGFSQPVFKNDIAYEDSQVSLVRKIDTVFHLQKNNDFEFQLLVSYSKIMKTQLFILALRNKQWSARLFEKTRKDLDTLIEIPVRQADVSKLWKQLEKNKILSIPKEEDLRDKDGKEINDPIFDGVHYRFSLIASGSKKSYSYICPKSFSKDYKYIKVYSQVVLLIELVFKYFKINLNYIC